jgi:hypothetical protein
MRRLKASSTAASIGFRITNEHRDAGVLAAIGDVIVAFGRIEYETTLAIKNMVGDFKQG